MYKTFVFNEKASNEILSALVSEKRLNNLSEALVFLLSEQKYEQIKQEHLKKFIEEVFWSSTFTEERNLHFPSVSLTPPVSVIDELFGVGRRYKFHFSHSKTFEAKNLAKLATVLENTEHHLGVWINENNELEIWGFTTTSDFVAKAIEIGQILLIIQGSNYKEGRKILIDNSKIAFIKDFNSIFPPERQHVFARLVKEIRIHRHGGTLLVVKNNNSWKKSIDSGIYFNPYSESLEKYTDEIIERRGHNKAFELHNLMGEKHLKLLGKLTALDGATIVTPELKIIAFGAKIKQKTQKANKKLNDILEIEPFEGSEEKTIQLFEIGGMRHQSAARFISDQRNSFVIVSSQDGKISLMSWDQDFERVRVVKHAEYLFL